MTIRAIIFDLSDTLVIGLGSIGPRLETMLKIPAGEIPDQLRDDAMLDFLLGGCTEDEYLSRVKSIYGWEPPIEDIKAVIREHFKDAIPGMPDIVAGLARSYPLYLLSDHGREWARYIESAHPFMSLFRRRFYSFDLHARKKKPETFAEVVRQIGAQPGECLMIDDRQPFLDAAGKAGLQTLLFEGSDMLRAALMQMGIIL